MALSSPPLETEDVLPPTALTPVETQSESDSQLVRIGRHRLALSETMYDTISTDMVSEVMTTIYNRAVGLGPIEIEDEAGNKTVELRRVLVPNVTAQRLFLAYAVGAPTENVSSEGTQRKYTLTGEDIRALKEIGKRYGVVGTLDDIKIVKVVENECTFDAQAKEVELPSSEEGSQQNEGSDRESEGSCKETD